MSYIQLMRLNKPVGIFLLLWPTYWALWLGGNGRPAWLQIIIFTLGVILMRSVGCVLNDIADRNFDSRIQRTKMRPLATGQIPLKAAWVVAIILLFGAANLLWFLNKLTQQLALLAVLLAATYPYTKCFLRWPQIYLGMTFSVNILMAFCAICDAIPATGWILFIANFCWIVAYDTQYAMMDYQDDLKVFLHSTAIAWKSFSLPAICALQGIFILLMSILGYQYRLSLPYWSALLGASLLFGYQYYLIQYRQAPFLAFLNNQSIGLCIFAGIWLHFF